MGQLIADALRMAGIGFTTPDERRDATGLDFRLDNGVEIEVKRLHSPRIERQMASVENVVVAQGEAAVRFLAESIAARRR